MTKTELKGENQRLGEEKEALERSQSELVEKCGKELARLKEALEKSDK